MSLSVFYYFICPCLCRCRSFNPSLCRLSPFRLSYVTVSRPCRLSKFTLTGPLLWEYMGLNDAVMRLTFPSRGATTSVSVHYGTLTLYKHKKENAFIKKVHDILIYYTIIPTTLFFL